MALSQAYLEWEQQTMRRGVEQGERQVRQKTIPVILTTRFGVLDSQLEAIVPALIELPIETSTPLLLQLSRAELLHRFST